MSEEENKDLESTEKKAAEPPRKKRLWLKILLILFGLFCCLIIGLYFYISSAAFIRGNVFTEVEKNLNQPISSEEINFNLFSGIEFKKFSLGDDPFLKAETIRVKYELLPMLSEEFNIGEMTIENAEMNVIINRDGKLNLLSKVVEKIEDQAEKQEKKDNKDNKKDDSEKSGKSAKAPKLNIRNISVKNLKLHVFKDSSDEEDVFELNLENFSFSLPEITNGKDLIYELETAINCKAGEKFHLKSGKIKVSGKAGINENLEPKLVNLDVQITDLDAVNQQVQLPLSTISLLADLGIDGEKLTINSFTLSNPEKKSDLNISGSIEKEDVDLKVAVQNIDSTILDILLVPLSGSKPVNRWQKALAEVSNNKIAGFGSTVINFDGSVKGNGKKSANAQGHLEILNLPMVQISDNSSVVPISTKVDYNLTTDGPTGIVEVKKFSIDIHDPGKNIVSMDLNSPLKLDTQNNKLSSEKDDSVTFKLNRFDLNLLKAFMKEEKRNAFNKGFLTSELELISRNSGSEILLNLNKLSLEELSIKKGESGERLENINLKTSSSLAINELDKISLNNFDFTVMQSDKKLVSVKGGGLINLDKVEADITLNHIQVEPNVISFVPEKTVTELGLTNVNLSSDKLKIFYTKGGVTAEGRTFIRNLGLNGEKIPQPARISTSTEFKVSMDENESLTIENLDFNLINNGQRAIATKLSGMSSPKTGVASISFSNLHVQPGLGTLLPPELKRKFGLNNINLDSKDLKIDVVKEQISVKGSVFSNGIELSGEQFREAFTLSHSTTVDVLFVKDRLLDIKGLNLSLQTDKNEAFAIAAIGTFRPSDRSIELDVKELAVNSGMRKLLPAEIINKFGLHNLNLKSKGIKVNFAEGKAGYVKADLSSENLGLAGTQFKPFSISQSLNVDLAINQNGILTVSKFHSNTDPSFSQPLEVVAKGKVDLNFQREDSEISIDIPSVVDLDSLLALMKKQEKKSAVQSAPSKKTGNNNKTETPAPAEEKKHIKLTVRTSVNEVLFEQQSIKGIRATAFIDGDNYTLKEAVLQVGESVLKASGKMNNGPAKALNVNVTSSGPINLSPINDIVNQGTEKELSGKITIQQLNATTSGKNNEDLTNNLKAVGKMYLQDLKMKNYASVYGMDWVLDGVLGVNPANIDFTEGIVDFKMENGVLTLNQVDMRGSSLALNPRGTIDLRNNQYDIKMKTGAGFSGGKLVQLIRNTPAAMNFINSKTDEYQKFQEKFPYDPQKQKHVMKKDFLFNKVINLNTEGRKDNIVQNLLGINHVANDFLTAMLTAIATEANMKEVSQYSSLLTGKGNLKDNILNIGLDLLKREMDRKDKDDDKEEKKNDPVNDILNILNRGSRNKNNDQKKKEPPKKEEKKKEEPINKKDDLIKKLDDLFK